MELASDCAFRFHRRSGAAYRPHAGVSSIIPPHLPPLRPTWWCGVPLAEACRREKNTLDSCALGPDERRSACRVSAQTGSHGDAQGSSTMSSRQSLDINSAARSRSASSATRVPAASSIHRCDERDQAVAASDHLPAQGEIRSGTERRDGDPVGIALLARTRGTSAPRCTHGPVPDVHGERGGANRAVADALEIPVIATATSDTQRVVRMYLKPARRGDGCARLFGQTGIFNQEREMLEGLHLTTEPGVGGAFASLGTRDWAGLRAIPWRGDRVPQKHRVVREGTYGVGERRRPCTPSSRSANRRDSREYRGGVAIPRKNATASGARDRQGVKRENVCPCSRRGPV